MARIKPYGGTSLARLSELIRVSQQPILPENVKYSFSDLMGGMDHSEGDTVVTVVASIGTRVDDPVVVHYRRLDIGILAQLPDGFVLPVPVVEVPFTTHAILPQINEALGLELTTDEVLNETFTEQLETYPLTISGNKSFSWVDSTYNFTMGTPDIDLGVAIPDPVLDGLVYLQPV